MATGSLLAAMAVMMLAAALFPGRAPGASWGARLQVLSETELEDQRQASRPLSIRLLRPFLLALADRLPKRARLSRADLVAAGMESASPAEFNGLKVLGAGVLLVLTLAASSVIPLAVALSPMAAWLGFVLPSLVISRRAASRRRQVGSELPDLIGLLRALTSSGLAIEPGLQLVADQLARANPDNVLAAALRRAMSHHALGQPLLEALERMADELGVDEVRMLVAAIGQGRRLGAGMDTVLREQELLTRMNQRNRAVAASAQVGNKLMAVLVVIYLPEFLCLVIIPLFWGVMIRAFG